ncbi:hypothetical protein ACFLZ1_00470 [Patescibacteria group bacterium]
MINIKNIIKKYWFLAAMLVFIAILFLLSLLLKNSVYKKDASQLSDSAVSWKGIQPGITNEEELKDKLGQPLKEYYQQDTKILEYPSDYKQYPNQVYLENQTISFVKEQVSLKQNLYLKDFINQYGSPDLIMYDESLGNARPLNIYPNHGLAVAAHIDEGLVAEIWYFPAMSLKQFYKTYSQILSQTPIKKF